LQEDAQRSSAAFQSSQQQVQDKSSEIGRLENEVVQLKTRTGDSDTLGVIKRELSEQVAHIKKLESTNREQHAELKQFRKAHKSIEVVEEEKRVLETRIRMMDDLRRELSESHLQRQILEDEKKSWTSYLENESSLDGEKQFDSPEALARALVQERLEKMTLVEKLGSVEPELAEKDSIIKGLEEDLQRQKKEVEKLRKSDGGGDYKKLARIDRQRALAVKEVDFLRAQLQTFDTEETTFQAGKFDEQKSKRIQELESMVDQYRNEVQALNGDLAKASSEPNTAIAAGTKRTRSEEPDERLGQISRKNRKLQEEVSKLSQTTKVLRNDLAAQKTLLASQTAISRTRMLELRSNPTSDHFTIKAASLSALKAENAALLQQLEGLPTTKSVPIPTLENARRDISDMEKTVADKEKRMLRLKQIWSSKSLEFREAVASVLGWKLDFMPNGRVRVTSMFYPSSADSEDGGEENSIIFDGENGTMKISGGPKSSFALEIKEMIRFWVENRKEIPCFLAACTLEFYKKTTKASRM
jgi:mitotic spindle assembly checkpoint protein MAD1